MFPDGEYLHATIKDTDQCIITCLPIKPNNMINIKCDLGFLINVPSKIYPTKNQKTDQMLHESILVFITIKEYMQHMVYFQIDQVYAEHAKKMMI